MDKIDELRQVMQFKALTNAMMGKDNKRLPKPSQFCSARAWVYIHANV
jgi:hypothetical protein